ncbi:MAG: hypothetical protein WBW79_03070 [Desulfocapsaceae bacterium]
MLKKTPLARICFSLFFITLALISCSSSSIRTSLPLLETAIKECVILIHGLGRTHRSMRQMELRLREEGYITVNLNYPSRSKTIEQIVVEHVPEAFAQCRINDTEKTIMP